jgi:hypothetical protein
MADSTMKLALRLAAQERVKAANLGPMRMEPEIVRRHVDGPYLLAMDRRIVWLSPLERLLTKLGIWDAWEIEWRHFPLPVEERP